MTVRTKTGGRKTGTPNKRTQDITALLDRLGCNPIEGMAHIASFYTAGSNQTSKSLGSRFNRHRWSKFNRRQHSSGLIPVARWGCPGIGNSMLERFNMWKQRN
jgi:hypothetical protein